MPGVHGMGPTLTFDGPLHVVWNEKRLRYFAGTDYHRLAFEPEVQHAVQLALQQQGLSSGGSRLTTGNNATLVQLETLLARFFGVEDALVVGSGYLANLILLQTLRPDFDVIIADEQAHASLLDAARAVQLPVSFFKHRDVESLQHTLNRIANPRRALVVTDGIFAARGEVAPLGDYWKAIAAVGASLLVDDAHGMAVAGERGRGTWEKFGLSAENLYITGTLSKGFGVFGGVILATHVLKQRIVEQSAAFVGHTPMPVPVIAGAAAAVQFLTEHRERVHRVQQAARWVKQHLADVGYAVPQDAIPIISIAFPEAERVRKFQDYLLDAGVFPPFNQYPGAPAGGHFRFVVTSRHTEDDMHQFVEILKRFRNA